MKDKGTVVTLKAVRRSGLGMARAAARGQTDILFVGPAAYRKIKGFKIM
jgi:hypothetical protein